MIAFVNRVKPNIAAIMYMYRNFKFDLQFH